MRPAKLKTIGILGGMSDQATMEYYKLINSGVNKHLGGWDIAETVIVGVNFGNIEYFVRNNAWNEARIYLEEKILNLQGAGAELLLCVSNTMHRVLDEISDVLKIPFLHIADPTGEAIRCQKLTKIGLIGTKPVMEADFLAMRYREKFGIDILVPPEEDQVIVDKIIFDELVKGVIKESSRQIYADVCFRLADRGAEGVILGCTEIPSLIKETDVPNSTLSC